MKVGILGSGDVARTLAAAFMVNPSFAAGPPTMFICGNDDDARQVVRGLLEPLCMLWCIPGFLRNEWAHAFKLLT